MIPGRFNLNNLPSLPTNTEMTKDHEQEREKPLRTLEIRKQWKPEEFFLSIT